MAVDVELISSEESWSIFDEAAKRELSLTGDEFVQQWDAGELNGKRSTAVMRVAMLRPRGR